MKTGPRLELQGVPWQIPAINQEFQRVIRSCAQDVEYVWVDVACVNQDPKLSRANYGRDL